VSDHNVRYRLSRALIRTASWFVPRERRTTWRQQWHAELAHRWKHRDDGLTPSKHRGIVVWSLGAFGHAWYLLRTEFTMDLIWQDIRYAFRSLRHGRGIVALAIVSLALGIGANTTIFSGVDVFMFRPLPYPESDRIVRLYSTNEERGWSRANLSVPDFLDYRADSHLMDVAASDGRSFNLSGDGIPERVSGQAVTSNFFRVVGVYPMLGRGFDLREETPGYERVAILSYGIWQRRFGADSSIVGKTIQLDGQSHTVVGVMPARFWFANRDIAIWTPLAFTGDEARDRYGLAAYARLGKGASQAEATAELDRLARRMADAYPETSAGNGVNVISLHSYLFDDDFRLGTTIASVAVALVLLIACANVANLLLARAASRRREVALRRALGAGRSRIVRQFLFESLIIAALGGLMGTALSIGGIRGLVSWMPDWFPRVDEITLDGRVLVYAAVISCLTGIVFGMAPAMASSRPDLTDTLKEGSRTGTGAGGNKLRRLLVVGEISLAFVLLISSTLLVQGFARIRLVDRGFDATDVVSMRITLPETRYPDSASVRQFWTQLRTRIESAPSVVTASATTLLPMSGNIATYFGLSADELSVPRPAIVSIRIVDADYFSTLDIPVLEGRGIERRDRAGATRVVVVNSAFAARHWPNQDAVGKQVFFNSGPREVVGVAANTQDLGPDDGIEPMVYQATQHGMYRSLAWIVETNNDTDAFGGVLRAIVQELDPTLPAYNLGSLATTIDEIIGGEAIMAKIMAALAVIALVLAIGGVYGVMAYTISQRTHEMGIRLALGARHTDVIRLVVGHGARLSLFGLVIGLGVGLAVTRSLSTFLYGVSPFDFQTYTFVTLLLLGAAVAASYLPARRTMRIDPISALRTD